MAELIADGTDVKNPGLNSKLFKEDWAGRVVVERSDWFVIFFGMWAFVSEYKNTLP